MRSLIISSGFLALIGVVIVLLLQSPDTLQTTPKSTNSPPESPLVPDTTSNLFEGNNGEINKLRQQLQQEIAARQQLQNTVDELSKKVAALAPQQASPHETTGTSSANESTLAKPQNNAWFNQQALLDAGMDKATAQSLQSRFETQELETLYLRDRAMREGWFGSRRYRNELELLDAQLSGLQAEIGDQAYEAFLFASGQPNQVMVQSVLANSSAATAGIRANDRILNYGGQRIFNWRDLRTATTQGTANETVIIEIMRNDKRLQLYVPRGPLGLRMNSASMAP